MGKTFVEKILSKGAHHNVSVNDLVIVDVNVMMASDTTAPIAIQSFRNMNGQKLAKPEHTVFVLDHATLCPTEKIAGLHKIIRDFSNEQGCVLCDQNSGVCHQVMIEENMVKQGDIVLGADSHTCSYGAVGAFSTGVGATDLSAAMLTGKTWLKVPETTRIELEGTLPKGVYPKDVILKIIGDLTSDGVTYEAVEFAGEGFAKFTKDEALTICNMSIEMGAKNGVFISSLTDENLIPDKDARYSKVLKYNANDIEPQIACPHKVDNVKSISEMEKVAINLVYIGSCTNGRIEDIAIVTKILKNKKIAKNVRVILCPASSRELKKACDLGYISDLIDSGVTISTPGCSLCVGTLGGVPANGEVVLSTTNRNFKGRMGNNQAYIYLASPATAAASALAGYIVDPREVMIDEQ